MKSVDQLLRKAQTHISRGELQLAEPLLEEVLERYPQNRRAKKALQALRQQDHAGKSPALPADVGQALINLFHAAKYGELLSQCEELTKQYPDAPLLLQIQGSAYAECGAREKAIESFLRCLELAPGNAQTHNNLGVVYKDIGKLAEALNCFQSATALKPDFYHAYNNEGATLRQQGETEPAIAAYKTALKHQPRFAAAHNNLGNALKDNHQLQEAQQHLKIAIQEQAEFPEAHNNLGVTLKLMGDLDGAIECFQIALKQRPQYAEAFNNMGDVFQLKGKNEKAMEHFQRALHIRPDYPEAIYNLGNSLERLGRTEDAIAQYHRSLGIQPNSALTHNNLGIAYDKAGRVELAENSFRKAVELDPEFAMAHNNLGAALSKSGKSQEALEYLSKAIAIDPVFVEAHCNLGAEYYTLGYIDQAVDVLEHTLQIDPLSSDAHNALGTALKSLGRIPEADDSFAQAIKCQPYNAMAYKNLCSVRKFEDSDPLLHQMDRLLATGNLSHADQAHLCFALYKAYDDFGDHEKAYKSLKRANELRKEELEYDRSHSQAQFKKIKASFASKVPSLTPEPPGIQDNGPHLPIFVVGMPRSGTTLIEQILASHSRIHGAGELEILGEAIQHIETGARAPTVEQLSDLRKAYLSGLKELGVTEQRISDKTPLNFRWIGFILGALPESKIIHIKRDARATCWSNYKLSFSNTGNRYAYDLQDLADYYRMYLDLMEFWNKKYPGKIYNMDYQTLTENQETETRHLLEYLELDWQNSCLNFQDTERAVQTASAVQVRQGMYQGSSDAWRHYEPYLDTSFLELAAL